jgi:hypothetical protein
MATAMGTGTAPGSDFCFAERRVWLRPGAAFSFVHNGLRARRNRRWCWLAWIPGPEADVVAPVEVRVPMEMGTPRTRVGQVRGVCS